MSKGQKKLIPGDFVHLHNHSHYSLLDGLSKIKPLVESVKKLGMNAVAVTDHGTMSGLIEFYKEANTQEIKPVLGMEAYVAPRLHTDRDPAKDKQYYHLILIAMNQVGYQNLMRLSTTANLDGFYYKPRIDRNLLEKYNEGLIVLSGCIGGEVGDALRQGQLKQAEDSIRWYKKVFGDRYYLEIQDHGHPDHPSVWQEQVEVNNQLMELADKHKIELALTCDAHYLTHADQEAHEILLCVQTGAYLSDENRMSLSDMELHLTDPKEVIDRWSKTRPDAVYNTRKIAERCMVDISLGNILIPKFTVPKGESEKSYLHKLAWQGLAYRYGGISVETSQKLSVEQAKKKLDKEIIERAQFEMDTIDHMGFNGYFLIIWDFINWGKNQGIVFGPGRGSAAGSIVAYALRITELDPIKYGLLFERFLNPDRISMPDVDIDIQDTRRGEVIQYCVDKYGADRVANIVTFGTMAARNAVRDVARVLQVPYAEADRIAKMIPPPIQGRHIPLAKSLKENTELKAENENNETSARVFDLATKLEGTIRSHGVHAAGVVIAPDDIVKFVPLEMAQKGVVATQYSMGPIEDLGLLKMDFLGLSNLTIIKNALRIIKKVYKKDIDLDSLPLDDPETFKLFQRGDTTGVFQLESSGMKRYLKELKPTVFDDIIAMGALYRPGPLTAGLTDKFIARKNGLEKVSYDHELMEPALKDTFGVMVYQEQFMRIVRDMCGFTGGESDTLRKAVGKKNRDLMAKMKSMVIEGARKKGVDVAIAEKFWKDLEGFADYAFNKSHAACYGLISYQTAYLKAHYPSAFMAALMTSDYDDIDRLSIEITECKHVGIEVLPPDINESFVEFAVVSTGDPKHDPIRFGMNAIKNVGTGAVEEILSARESGHFNKLEDIFSKVNPRIVNRKALESLIKAGALDRFGDRSDLLNNIDMLLAYSSRLQKERAAGQVGLFSEESAPGMEAMIVLDQKGPEYGPQEQLKWERELLGLYLSQHPLKAYETYLAELTMPLNELTEDMDNKLVIVGGAITELREITTKNGQKMAFVKIADLGGEIEVILFPGAYQQTTGIWERDRVVLIRGKLNSKDRQTGELTGELKILADEAREITLQQASGYESSGKKLKLPNPSKSKTPAPKPKPKDTKEKLRLYIRLRDTKNQEQLTQMKAVIDKNSGSTDVVLVLGDNGNKQIIKLPSGVELSNSLLSELKNLVGDNEIVVQ